MIAKKNEDFLSGNWKFLLDRIAQTENNQSKLIGECEKALQSTEKIHHVIGRKFKENEMSVLQSFIQGYFRRNYCYLYSSFILGNMGFISPSQNLQRTVYETILRGYFFIVNPDEANQRYEVLGENIEKEFLIKKRHYTFSVISGKLYSKSMIGAHKKFYKNLCNPAHPGLKGIFLDFPVYTPSEIENVLKTILMLAYGNIQMNTECFLPLLDSPERKIVLDALERIALYLKEVPIFEPDNPLHASKIKFNKGNFKKVLT